MLGCLIHLIRQTFILLGFYSVKSKPFLFSGTLKKWWAAKSMVSFEFHRHELGDRYSQIGTLWAPILSPPRPYRVSNHPYMVHWEVFFSKHCYYYSMTKLSLFTWNIQPTLPWNFLCIHSCALKALPQGDNWEMLPSFLRTRSYSLWQESWDEVHKWLQTLQRSLTMRHFE